MPNRISKKASRFELALVAHVLSDTQKKALKIVCNLLSNWLLSSSNDHLDQRFLVVEYFRIIHPKNEEIFFLCKHKYWQSFPILLEKIGCMFIREVAFDTSVCSPANCSYYV